MNSSARQRMNTGLGDDGDHGKQCGVSDKAPGFQGPTGALLRVRAARSLREEQ